MADFILKKMLGGIANGLDVPSSWVDEGMIPVRGQDVSHRYTLRPYFDGADKYDVWVYEKVEDEVFWTVMRWHRECYRGDLVAAQKDMIRESMTAATNYTNVITLAGFAALFALLTQGHFTAATKLSASLFLAISVAIFVALEVLGMVLRSNLNMSLVTAVNDPPRYQEHIRGHQEHIATLGRKLLPYQRAGMWISIAAGLACFLIICSALLHGLWLAFLAESMSHIRHQ